MSRYNEANILTHAGQHFTAMDDQGPRVRIEAPGGRVVTFTDVPADIAQRRLETITGPFSSLAEIEHRVRTAFRRA